MSTPTRSEALQGAWVALQIIWKAISATIQGFHFFATVALIAAAVSITTGDDLRAWTLVVIFWWLPALVAGTWAVLDPVSFETRFSAPLRRATLRRGVRRGWGDLTEAAGWTHYVVRDDGQHVRISPPLDKVTTDGDTLSLTVKPLTGQTRADLAPGVPRLAETLDAVTHTTRPALRSSGLVVDLVMRDHTATPQEAAGVPQLVEPVGSLVPVGSTITGARLSLRILGLHTLVVGRSGSGKGSWLWSIVCGLAGGIRDGRVQCWGIDLKGGVEIATGAGLFAHRAYTYDDALAMLRHLVQVMTDRASRMAGVTRQHAPTTTEPLHVLVIDELAALTAYAPRDVRAEADQLLALLLTQGRALGISVIAFVQDPRKEVVPQRGLFTQTVALRLATRSETVMVLGSDDAASMAPAHTLPADRPGTGYLIDEAGLVQQVRSSYWTDDLIRTVARTHSAPVLDALMSHTPLAPSDEPTISEPDSVPTAQVTSDAPQRPRQPKRPRSRPTDNAAA